VSFTTVPATLVDEVFVPSPDEFQTVDDLGQLVTLVPEAFRCFQATPRAFHINRAGFPSN
jgi:hypothetical protein